MTQKKLFEVFALDVGLLVLFPTDNPDDPTIAASPDPASALDLLAEYFGMDGYGHGRNGYGILESAKASFNPSKASHVATDHVVSGDASEVTGVDAPVAQRGVMVEFPTQASPEFPPTSVPSAPVMADMGDEEEVVDPAEGTDVTPPVTLQVDLETQHRNLDRLNALFLEGHTPKGYEFRHREWEAGVMKYCPDLDRIECLVRRSEFLSDKLEEDN